MSFTIFHTLGEQLLAARERRGLSQLALATRLARDRARISELERDLATDRRGRDRLTLFAEICDALDLMPVLLPKSRMGEVKQLIGDAGEQQNKGTAASALRNFSLISMMTIMGSRDGEIFRDPRRPSSGSVPREG